MMNETGREQEAVKAALQEAIEFFGLPYDLAGFEWERPAHPSWHPEGCRCWLSGHPEAERPPWERLRG